MRHNKKIISDLAALRNRLEKVYAGEYGGPVYLIGRLDTTRFRAVACQNVEMDKNRVNTKYCHVSDQGLVNSTAGAIIQGTHFNKYRGTCSSAPIPPFSDTSHLTVPPAVQYSEVNCRLLLLRKVTKWPLFEVALSQKSQVDTSEWASKQKRSWAVRLAVCVSHFPGVCIQIWSEGEHVDCHTFNLSNAPGTSVGLNYGVIVDSWKGRLVFLDLDKEIVLKKIDVRFDEYLYPLFGVGTWSNVFTAKLNLVSGEHIAMTETKKSIILKVLSEK